MILFAFILFIAYCFYLIWENYRNIQALSTFKYIIHVNGIRGKTTTCRLIDAAMRKKYSVYTKTTGSTPFTINTKNQETPIKRLGPANIKEQLKIIREASKEGADVLIIECMAVNPILQKICQERIVKSSITVITNVKYDHIYEMGSTLPEIAASLASTVPKDGILFTGDPDFYDYFDQLCQQKNSKAILCPSDRGQAQNVSIAREVCRYAGISDEDFSEGILHMTQDFGTTRRYELPTLQGAIHFLNLFSVNDPGSTTDALYFDHQQYPDSQTPVFVYNARDGRPDRCILFADYFFKKTDDYTVYIIGNCRFIAKKILSRNPNLHLILLKDWKELLSLPDGTFLVGIANIKGEGYEMIEYAESKGVEL